MVVEAAREVTPAEANGNNPEGASPIIGADGTPGLDTTVHQDDANLEQKPPAPTPEELALDELKYSERSWNSMREAAVEEARTTALREREDSQKTARQRLVTAVTEASAHPAPVIDAVKKELLKLSSDLDDDEMEPILKAVRDARSSIEGAALLIAADEYYNAINAGFDTEADAQAFWEKGAALDPALDASKILPLYAEHKALSTRAVKEAAPEDLLKANSKLRAHFDVEGDRRQAAGRTIGQKDQLLEEGSSEGRAGGGALTPSAYAAALAAGGERPDPKDIDTMTARFLAGN